ncbi:MAG: hypothetical protein E7290_09430 [Lachnospiraceae bacterium]|nr:hypothetical protein [Lachnospiraceae bacterium]
MWNRRKIREMKQKIADLERQVQGQPQEVDITPLDKMKEALKESLCQAHQSSSIEIIIPKEFLQIIASKHIRS